jgi:hypothetical protein
LGHLPAGLDARTKITASPAWTFTIKVKGPQAALVLRAVELSGGTCQFSRNAEPGRKYRVQHKARLEEAGWKSLGLDIVATGSTASAEDDVSGVGQRFYHIVQVD